MFKRVSQNNDSAMSQCLSLSFAGRHKEYRPVVLINYFDQRQARLSAVILDSGGMFYFGMVNVRGCGHKFELSQRVVR